MSEVPLYASHPQKGRGKLAVFQKVFGSTHFAPLSNARFQHGFVSVSDSVSVLVSVSFEVLPQTRLEQAHPDCRLFDVARLTSTEHSGANPAPPRREPHNPHSGPRTVHLKSTCLRTTNLSSVRCECPPPHSCCVHRVHCA